MPAMRSLPLAEAAKVIAAMPVKYAAIAAIGVTTGCRISEILSLCRRDVLDEKGRIRQRIRFEQLKTRQEHSFRALGIPANFRKYLVRHLLDEEQRGYERPDDLVFRGQLGKPLSRKSVYAFFRSTLGRGYGTHWMRKTFAQLLYAYFLTKTDAFQAIELVRRALGHRRIETTIKYLGIRDDEIREAQNAIFNSVGDTN